MQKHDGVNKHVAGNSRCKTGTLNKVSKLELTNIQTQSGKAEGLPALCLIDNTRVEVYPALTISFEIFSAGFILNTYVFRSSI